MLARDLMETRVLTVNPTDAAAEVCDLFQHARVHCAPVVDPDGKLVGIVSQEDLLMGGTSHAGESGDQATSVGEIMTAPPISASTDTRLVDLCRMMWRLRIHHLPIVEEDRVVGMISSLDICRVVGEEKLAVESGEEAPAGDEG